MTIFPQWMRVVVLLGIISGCGPSTRDDAPRASEDEARGDDSQVPSVPGAIDNGILGEDDAEVGKFHLSGAYRVRFVSEETVCTLTDRGQVDRWDLHSGASTGRVSLAAYGMSRWASLSSDGRKVIGCESGHGSSVAMWDAVGGGAVRIRRVDGRLASRAAFTPDGRFFAAVVQMSDRPLPGSDLEAQVFDAARYRRVARFAIPDGIVRGVNLLSGGEVLAITSEQERACVVRFFRVADAQMISVIEPGAGANETTFTPDGQTMALGHYRTAELWDVPTRSRVFEIPIGGSVESLRLSNDGSLLLAGLNQSNIELWDTRAPRRLALFRGHSGPVFDVAFSPDHRLAASVSVDDTLRIWRLPTR